MSNNGGIFKVGDYIVTSGYSKNYDGKVLKVNRISEAFLYINETNHDNVLSKRARFATREEILNFKGITDMFPIY